MGDARDAFRLFTTTDEDEADTLAKKLEKANRRHEKRSWCDYARRAHAHQERGDVRHYRLGDPEWRPALLGLVAGILQII